MRILDVDLDFFVDAVAHFRDLNDLSRLSDEEYSAWPVEDAAAFLSDQCGLSGPLPGWAIERHGEAFKLPGPGTSAFHARSCRRTRLEGESGMVTRFELRSSARSPDLAVKSP